MALADILTRIDSDSQAEADAIIAAAEQTAARELTAARARAQHESEVALERGQRAAAAQAETVLASARLSARDAALVARRTVIDEALAAAAVELAGLPDDRYTEFFASRVADLARGGETVHVAAADTKRLAGLSSAVEKAAGRSLGLTYSSEPAPVDHGVVLVGDRARVDISLAAVLAERRGELEMIVSKTLFGPDREG